MPAKRLAAAGREIASAGNNEQGHAALERNSLLLTYN